MPRSYSSSKTLLKVIHLSHPGSVCTEWLWRQLWHSSFKAFFFSTCVIDTNLSFSHFHWEIAKGMVKSKHFFFSSRICTLFFFCSLLVVTYDTAFGYYVKLAFLPKCQPARKVVWKWICGQHGFWKMYDCDRRLQWLGRRENAFLDGIWTELFKVCIYVGGGCRWSFFSCVNAKYSILLFCKCGNTEWNYHFLQNLIRISMYLISC